MAVDVAGLELTVLGPVAASRDGRALDLRGPRQRAVLAVLAAAAPATVGVHELLAAAWPPGARPGPGTLQHYVSRLRAVLETAPPAGAGPEVLVRRGNGYALVVAPETVDAVRFTRLAAEGVEALAGGRAGHAAQLLEAGLGLWRGAAYADVADLDAMVPVVARLTELRTAAAEDLIDALLRSGRAAEAVGRAREHTAAHPLRERGWELLALALYRTGRQAEALSALRTVRQVLAEELGLDPGPGLVAVEAAVRAQAAPTDPVPAVPVGPASAGPVGPGTPPHPSPPVPLGDLVGRDAEAAQVDNALDRCRLVTLTGPGGVGKTRLALAVAHRRVARSSDVVLAELGALDDPALLPSTVAAALGVPGGQGAAPLAEVVRGWSGLLVLDNCEHLVEHVAGLLPALLGSAPGLRVLVTSREVLDVGGEHVHEVRPLDPAGEATELFMRRVGAVAPGWVPDPADQIAVRRICALLDGLPLAVELAAARVRVLSVPQLAEALEGDCFGVLADAPRDAPRSQRGLARTVEWSCAGLDPAEQSVFRRLAVFAADFDLEAAAAVAGSGQDTALALVAGLVRRSLLQVQPGPGPRRYRLLEVLRRYALDRMDEAEAAGARERHRRYVVGRVRAADRLTRGPGAAAALAELRRDRPEHRAALASAAAHGDHEVQTDLAAGLAWSWYRGGDLVEGRRALLRATGGRSVAETAPDPVRAARALLGLGKLDYLAGEPVAADESLRTAQRLAGRAEDPALLANALTWRAHVRSLTGPSGDALRLADEAVTRAAVAGEGWVTAEALMVRGLVLRVTSAGGDPRPALAAAVAAAEDAGYGWGAISSSWALMKAAADAGDLDGALAAAARVHQPLVTDGDVTSWLVLVHSTAAVLARTGRAEEAGVLAGAVQALGSRIGFAPERMDPVDGPREEAAVRDALGTEAYARATAAGRVLSREEVDQLLGTLLT